MSNEKYEVGIIHIHGIGDQKKGETLISFFEPFFLWIGNWLQGKKNYHQKIRRKKKTSIENENYQDCNVEIKIASQKIETTENPGYAILDYSWKDKNKKNCSTSWLLAESHWAHCFTPPVFKNVVFWIIKVIPIMYGTYFIRRMKFILKLLKNSHNLFIKIICVTKLLVLLVASLLAFPSIFLLQSIQILLFFISLIPIKAFKNYSVFIQKIVINFLGDSYLFLNSTIRKKTILHKISADIKWLQTKCRNIVIVAHSQGAALTYLLLQDRLPDNLKGVITYGSGIQKLNLLLSEKNKTKLERTINLSIIGTIFMFAIAISILGIVPMGQFPLFNYIGSGVLLFIYTIGFFLAINIIDDKSEIYDWSKKLKKKGIKWLDIYAKADPVPNGPIFHKNNVSNYEGIEVNNNNSIFLDHTSYEKNSMQFYANLVIKISGWVKSKIPLFNLTPLDLDILTTSFAFRKIYMSFQSFYKRIIMISFLFLLINYSFVVKIGKFINEIFWELGLDLDAQIIVSFISNNFGLRIDLILGILALILTSIVSLKINKYVRSWIGSLINESMFERNLISIYSSHNWKLLLILRSFIPSIIMILTFYFYFPFNIQFIKSYADSINMTSMFAFYQISFLAFILSFFFALIESWVLSTRSNINLKKNKMKSGKNK